MESAPEMHKRFAGRFPSADKWACVVSFNAINNDRNKMISLNNERDIMFLVQTDGFMLQAKLPPTMII